MLAYRNAEQTHKQCKQWVKKFNNCNRYDELVKVVSNYRKSRIATIVDVSFFFFQYIFADVEDKKRFSIIMEYMSSGAYPECKMINALCSIYNPDDVMQSFNYSIGAKGTIYKHKKNLKEYISCLKDGEIEFYSKGYFDKETHYYCEKTQGYREDNKYFPSSNLVCNVVSPDIIEFAFLDFAIPTCTVYLSSDVNVYTHVSLFSLSPHFCF